MAEPWIKVRVSLRSHPKMAHLPSDSARLGWFYVLLEAKLQKPLGVFVSRAHFVDVLGRFGRFMDRYITAGLLHQTPDLCADCQEVYPETLRAGMIVVHDYPREQRDPTNADRQAVHRNALRNAEVTELSRHRHAESNRPLTRAGDDGDRDRDRETKKLPPHVGSFSSVGGEIGKIREAFEGGGSA